MTPTCSIIIPHYNQADYLGLCLACLYNQSYADSYEIIVVDNGTAEELLSDLKSKFSGVRWFSQKKVQNPYASRNFGIQKATSSILLFLDAKCQPQTGWLDNMMMSHAMNPYSIVAGRYDLTYPSDAIKDKVYSLLYLNNEKNIASGYGVTAGNMLIPKVIFDKVGVFDTNHTSGRDILWSKKCLSAGLNFVYANQAVVSYPSQTWSILTEKIKKYGLGTPKDQRNASTVSGLLNYLPLKMSTFIEALAYRDLQLLSTKDKVELWLRTWFIKAKYHSYKRRK